MKRAKKFVLKICLVLALVLIITASVYISAGYNMYSDAITEKSIEDAVAEIRAKENYCSLDEMPKIYIDAVISAEDHRFYEHKTVDFFALSRAVFVNIKNGKATEGGSTITQQLAKNMYFTQSKSIDRKIAEYFVARALEKNYSKDEILELYLNSIYFGSGYYCIYDASMGYFGKEPSELTDYEAIMLAGLPNAPSVYSPKTNPELAKQRQNQVVNKMLKYNKITKEQANQILEQNEN